MMYKCKDCGKILDKFEDYCPVCGSDDFEIINATSNEKKLIDRKDIINISNISKVDFISWGVFIFCLVMSVAVWFIIKPPEPKNIQTEKIEQKYNKVPDINKIWNDAKSKNQSAEEVIYKKEDTVIQQQVSPKVNNQDIIYKSYPKTTTKKSTVGQVNKLPKVKNENGMREKTVQKDQPKKNVKQQENKVDTEKIALYKVKLRRALFNKINLYSMSGSGECKVQFAVASDGKLINRKFIQLSDNKSIDDAVYHMLMSLPYYDTPPSDIAGKLLKFYFRYDNGAYEFGYIN